MKELDLLKRRLGRERAARKEAERILEEKALELFRINEALEETVQKRTRQLRQSEVKYRSMIENMRLGLLEVDINDRIVKAYPLFCEMVGYKEEELEGKIASEVLVMNEYKTEIETQNEDRLFGKAAVYELEIIRKNGVPLNVLISGAPIFDEEGATVGSVGIHYDITKQKDLQKELELSKEAAERAQRAEKMFLANMSHEIRTPLNVMVGMSSLLENSDLNEEQRKYLNTLQLASDMLMVLISDILDLAKIDSGKIEIQNETFDIHRLINSVADIFKIKVENKAISFNTQVDKEFKEYLIGDKKLITQVLINLVGNAVKFTHKGEIKLGYRVLSQENKLVKIRFYVSDTGIGLTAEEAEVVFDHFAQANNEISERYGGTGLGLAISHKIVEHLGGAISVESEIGKGSDFYFDIPLELSDTRITKNRKENNYRKAYLSIPEHPILVVEDNLLNQTYVGALLEGWEISYKMVQNGQEAINAIKRQEFSCVLMDLRMPVMDGFEALAWIRRNSHSNKGIKIVAMSASTLRTEVSRAIESGFNEFVSKPFRPEQLFSVLTEILGSKDDEEGWSIDLQMIEGTLGTDVNYRNRIVAIFLDTIPEQIRAMSDLIKENGLVEIAEIAHKIKPNFAMVGIEKGTDICEEIEKGCRQSGSVVEIKRNILELEKLYSIVKHQLREMIQ